MAQDFNAPNGFTGGSALGTSLLTLLKKESTALGYNVWAVNTASERLYTEVYGVGSPPIGYSNYARACIYQDILNGKIYQMVGTENSSLWAEIGVSGTVTVLDKFIQLIDTPLDYTGKEGYGLRVNTAGDGLEFYELPAIPPTGLFITQAEKDKLAGIEANAQVNVPFENPCIVSAPFLEDTEGSVSPVPMALREADTPISIVNNSTLNGEFKSVVSDYKYATIFSPSVDTITGVAFDATLQNSPDGTMSISIYTVNAGVPDTVVASGSGNISSLVNGLNTVNFSTPLTVTTGTSYALVIGAINNTQGSVKWNEATTGTQSLVNINDQWLVINSNLSHKVFGYMKTTESGGVVPAIGTDTCILGFATTDTLSGEVGDITTCGKLCGFTGLIPFKKYYLATDGTITDDDTQTGLMVGVAVSTTCILIKNCGGVAPVNPLDTFHIKISETDVLGTTTGDNIDHQ